MSVDTLPYDVQRMVLERLDAHSRLTMRAVNKSWYNVFNDFPRWESVRIEAGQASGNEGLRSLLAAIRPRKILVRGRVLTPELLGVLSGSPLLEELSFAFCGFGSELDVSSLGTERNSSLKKVSFVGNRLINADSLQALMSAQPSIIELSSRTEPKNAAEMFWAAPSREWVCTRDPGTGTISSSFTKSGGSAFH
ncbi:hypothetical protein NDN08_000914 [Rhodosorus marinus]|uniref:F-box domain-containing protein n=1 Tax=Rhodosorus marinus TaxID=101924 RepID=A0AAV8UPC6_9RHOD|nr:hypothetical protein NDN08_000914 [Rhodosorus marinus]